MKKPPNLSPADYVLKQALVYLRLKPDDAKCKEMQEKEKDALKAFLDPSGNSMFLFAL
jgi:hypothetical protein